MKIFGLSNSSDYKKDPNFTGAIIKGFADALQTSLSFKTNLVNMCNSHFNCLYELICHL